MCFVFIESIEENDFERHKKTETHLNFASDKVICKICKSVDDSIYKEAHLQSIACFNNLIKCEVCDLSLIQRIHINHLKSNKELIESDEKTKKGISKKLLPKS